MSRMHTWSSKPTGGSSHEFKRQVPTDVDETDLIVGLFGSTERMVWHAITSATIAVAPGLRTRLPNVADAERYAANFVADGRKEVAYVPTKKRSEVDAQGFSESQLAFVEANLKVIEDTVEDDE